MIVHSRLDSSHLAANLLGDPSERDLFVYLPPGYEESDRRYPTAYLLHAFGETATQVLTPDTDGQRWHPPIEDVLDPVFGRLGVPPMIVVIPDGNSRDRMRTVGGLTRDRQLRGVRAARRRPCCRRQFGHPLSKLFAFGSRLEALPWNVASRNPDVFGALATLSGDSFLDMTHKFMPYKSLDSIWPEEPNGPIEGNVWSQLVYDYPERIHLIQIARPSTSTCLWPGPVAS